MPIKKQPRLFVASSREAESVARAVKEGLDRVADVKLWWGEDLWTPGGTTLEDLLRLSAAYAYAVVILRGDDYVVFRGEEGTIPRDNVLFEAGLFMAHLGPKRTFIVVPKDTDVKILSDLAGRNILSYPRADEVSGYKGALKETVKRIRDAIKKQEADSPKPPYAALCGPSGFNETLAEAGKFLRSARQRDKATTVRNIALDMEHTWGVLRDNVLRYEWKSQLHWRSLLIDWQSEGATANIGDAVTAATARNSEEAMASWCSRHADKLPGRNITFECRAYSKPPLIHGILFNDDELYFSLLSYHSLGAAGVGYCHFRANPEDRKLRPQLAADYIRAFDGWFQELWEGSRPVWPAQA